MTRMITVEEDQWDKLEAVYEAAKEMPLQDGGRCAVCLSLPEQYHHSGCPAEELSNALNAVQTRQGLDFGDQSAPADSRLSELKNG